jgi:hypothetical protein
VRRAAFGFYAIPRGSAETELYVACRQRARKALLEHGFCGADLDSGRVTMDDAMLIMSDPAEADDAVAAACDRLRLPGSAGFGWDHSQSWD